MIETIAEIIKFTIPALTVFGTVYFLLNKMSKDRYNEEALRNGLKLKERNDGMKIQSCERLILFLERIDPINLYLRLNSGDITALQMQTAMLLAIQQEYDHNLTQQLYVSQPLWQIIKEAKMQISNIISQCGDKLYPSDPPSKLIDLIERVRHELRLNPLESAKTAIKNEIDLVINR